MKIKCILGLIFLAITVMNTGKASKELADAGTDLGFKLYHEAAKEEENVFLSPYSISTALALTYEGAKGDTKQEMADVLGFSKMSTSSINVDYQTMNSAIFETKEYILKTANRLYGRNDITFLSSFLNPLRQYYNAPLEKKDFAGQPEKSREEINEWVEDQTENMIKDLIPPGAIDGDTYLVLVNAIYFKGKWAQQFNEEDTEEEDFRVSNNELVKVPMMKLENKMFKMYYDENMKAKILQLPYDGNGDDEIDENDDVSMYIILPDEIEGLNDVTRDLNSVKLNTMINSMSYDTVSSVKLPKFNITQKLSLKQTLSNLGMRKAFSRNEADFSGMVESPRLFIGSVYHQAVVEVNEKGTTAAAATAVGMVATSLNAVKRNFEADHPFIFFIREENTGSTLFMGRIKNPNNGTIELDTTYSKSSSNGVQFYLMFLATSMAVFTMKYQAC